MAIGYIVLDDTRYPLVVGPRDGVLWITTGLAYVTVFPTRSAANAAIAWSRTYAARHGYRWGTQDYRIVRLAPMPRTQAVAKDGRASGARKQSVGRSAGNKKTSKAK